MFTSLPNSPAKPGPHPFIQPAPEAGMPELPRELGRFGIPSPGAPTVLVVAGLHGNEPAGIHAARRVIARLGRENPAFRGQVVALAGNLQALARGARYVDRDLNRAWTAEHIAAASAGQVAVGEVGTGPGAAVAPVTPAEDAELVALSERIDAILASATGPVYVLDMHTTSSESAPFALFADTLRNRSFALAFPLALVLGLEEQIEGAMLAYLAERGCVCLGIEGGQHASAAAVDNLEAVLWVALVAAGMIGPRDLPDLSDFHDRLAGAMGDVPRLLEVRYRHAIEPADAFHMAPGFMNFQPVTAGQTLARDRRGDVRARQSGRILMPLYQGQGEDGFFMTKAVNPRWLDVSTVLRHLNLGRVLPHLPGVRRDGRRSDTLLVNTRVARWFPLQVFHLLGYRKQRWVSDELVVMRRREE